MVLDSFDDKDERKILGTGNTPKNAYANALHNVTPPDYGQADSNMK